MRAAFLVMVGCKRGEPFDRDKTELMFVLTIIVDSSTLPDLVIESSI